MLTKDQERALKALQSGENVFLTGEAGTGKSYVLNAFLSERNNVLAMAPTGIAALNLMDGSTIHRTLKIKPEFQDPGETLKARKVLDAAEVIVIDEISMVRVDLFERVIKLIRLSEKKTGRKQIVLVGDFFQLPPVITDRDKDAMAEFYPDNLNGYAFLSPYWKELNLVACELKEIVRQSESEYISALNKARYGDKSCIPFFNQHAVSKRDDAPFDSIWLCATNRNATLINEARLKMIDSEEFNYVGEAFGTVSRGDMATDEFLTLKVGARVMAVVNDTVDNKYQNGSLGYVSCLSEDSAEVEFDNGYVVEIKPYTWEIKRAKVEDGEVINEVIGTFEQIPLRLAWAVTIHKSQGQTFENVNCETNVFQAGMLYVALSRCSNSEGLYVYPKIKESNLYPHDEVVEFYKNFDAPTVKILRQEYSCECGKGFVESELAVQYCPICGKLLNKNSLTEGDSIEYNNQDNGPYFLEL